MDGPMPQYTVLACPSCGGKTSLEAGTPLATCQYCGNQIILRPAEQGWLNYADQFTRRPEAAMPDGVQLNTTPDGIEIRRRWFSAKYIFLALFCVVWDGFLLFWYSIAFGVGAPSIMVLFPLLHVAVGLYLTYSTVAGFVNTSILRINRAGFSISHGPLPWPGGSDLPATDLEQLYTKEEVHRGKNGTTTDYTLTAVLRSGRSHDLLKSLPSPEMGFFIEQQVESYLRIEDRPMAGEMAR